MENFKKAKTHVGHGISQFELTNKLLNNLSQFDVSPIAKLVLLELSACYNPKKVDVFPKQKTLAKKIGVSERSIIRAVQELVKAGVILIESKYTNHYIFTSKIVCEWAEIEKNFEPEKMSDDLGQNDTSKRDKLSQHEQTIEQKNKPLNMNDYKTLKEYAIGRGAKNIQAYVNSLIKSGNYKEILDSSRKKEANNNAMLMSTKRNLQDLQFAKENAAVLPKDYFEKIRQNLKKA